MSKLVIGFMLVSGAVAFGVFALLRVSSKMYIREEKVKMEFTEYCDNNCEDCGNWHCCKVRDN